MTLHSSSSSEDRPIHVLVVSNHWGKKDNPTNGSIWVDRQVTALQNLGIKVSTFDAGTPFLPWSIFKKWLELRRAIRESKPDLVHARYGTLVGALSVCAGAPSIITYAGSDLLTGEGGISKARIWTGILLSNLASLRADAIICVSDELRRSLWWRSKDGVVIPDGVDLQIFKPHPHTLARQKLGWSMDEIVILIDAVRDPVRKGLEVAQRAMEIVRARLPRAELRVLKVANPADMPLYCSAANLLLCASRREGSPNIVKEAIACNLPVVSTPVGDVPELLARVQPSAIVPRDPRALGEAMLRMLEIGGRSNGRDHSESFNLDSIARRVVQVYKLVLDRRPEQARDIATPLEPAA